MLVPPSLVAACVSFATEVSAEATERVVELVAAGRVRSARAALTGDAALRFEALLTEWRLVGNAVDDVSVANAIRGASQAITSERMRQRVELVWTGPTAISSTLRSTAPALLEVINGARESVYLVTFAAYKVPEVSESLQAALRRGVRVVVVLESSSVSGGKVSFDPLPHLVSAFPSDLEVYTWPLNERQTNSRGKCGSLHAKFAVADRNRLLVSSANLTEHAFNLNIELGVLIAGGSAPLEAAEHVDELIRRGVFRPA